MKNASFKTCTIEAPCKINLHLKIGEKRPDGYHSLESLFATLAFADMLQFDAGGKQGDCSLSMTSERPEKPILPEDNLILRAVSLFRDLTGYKNGLSIRLKKRIPIGAGLGGGSSDAAATLFALNSLAGGPLSMEELSKTAALLGSDVPFFLSGGLAFVSGRGEVIEPVQFFKKFWVVLVKPPFASDTAEAYRLLDHAREGEKYEKKINELSKETLLHALEDDPGCWPYYNDFLLDPENENIEPNTAVYRTFLNALRKEGASFAGLSGSGSCCFGIFTSKNTAQRAVKELAECINRPATCKGQGTRPFYCTNFIKLTFFLARRADPVLKQKYLIAL